MRSIVGEKVYESWFSNLELSDATDDSLTLSTDTEFAEIWIRDNYMDVLSNQISMAANRKMKVELVAREDFSAEESARHEERFVRFRAPKEKKPTAVIPRR